MVEVNNLPKVVADFATPQQPPDLSKIWVCEYSASQQSVSVNTLDRVAYANAQMMRRGITSDWMVMYAGDEENARKIADRIQFVRDDINPKTSKP